MNSSQESSTYARIRKVGTVGRTLCTIGMVLLAMALPLMAYGILSGHANTIITWGIVTVGKHDPAQMTQSDKAALVAFMIVVTAVWMAVLWLMRQLFAQFTRGEVFTRGTARLTRWLGVWNLVLLIGLDPGYLLTGLFLLALGWGMDLAASLKQEQDLTV